MTNTSPATSQSGELTIDCQQPCKSPILICARSLSPEGACRCWSCDQFNFIELAGWECIGLCGCRVLAKWPSVGQLRESIVSLFGQFTGPLRCVAQNLPAQQEIPANVCGPTHGRHELYILLTPSLDTSFVFHNSGVLKHATDSCLFKLHPRLT